MVIFMTLAFFLFYVKRLLILYFIIHILLQYPFNRTLISSQVLEPNQFCHNNIPLHYSYPSLAVYQLSLVGHYFPIPSP